MLIQTIPTNTHGRYAIDQPAGDGPFPLLVGFHGYKENAELMLGALVNIRGDRPWLVVSVQALNRFYDRDHRAVIAGWMTSQDRELAIADNIAYAASVVAAVRRDQPTTATLVFAGFSQGVAMAYRAAAFAGPASGASCSPAMCRRTSRRWRRRCRPSDRPRDEGLLVYRGEGGGRCGRAPGSRAPCTTCTFSRAGTSGKTRSSRAAGNSSTPWFRERSWRGARISERHKQLTRGLPAMTLVQDLRYAFRSLVKTPTLTIAVILSLGLGIGANTTVFTWVQAVLLHPIPGAHDPDSLYVINVQSREGRDRSWSYPNFRDFRDRSTLVDFVAQDDTAMSVAVEGQAERAFGALVSGNYFQVMGIQPALGRLFTVEDDRVPGGHPVAVISFSYWQRRFAGDRAVVGRAVTINNTPMTIVGVTQEGFLGSFLGIATSAWVPMAMQAQVTGASRLESRGNSWMQTYVRLHSGTTRAQAQTEISGIMGQLSQEYRESNDGLRVEVVKPWQATFGAPSALGPSWVSSSSSSGWCSSLPAPTSPTCCYHARWAPSRSRRATLARRQPLAPDSPAPDRGDGARRDCRCRRRVFRYWTIRRPDGLRAADRHADRLRSRRQSNDAPLCGRDRDCHRPGVWSCAGLAGLTSRRGAGSERGGGPGHQRRPVRNRLRNGLVVGQVAICLVLLVGASLFARSLVAAQQISPGFEPRHMLIASVDLFPSGYTAETGRQFHRRLLEAIAAQPGVESASLARSVPLGLGGLNLQGVEIDGYTPRPNQKSTSPTTRLRHGISRP